MTRIIQIDEEEDKGRSAKGGTLRTSPFIFSLSSTVHSLKQPFQRMGGFLVGEPEALDAGFDMCYGILYGVGYEEKVQVLGGDRFFLQHFLNVLQEFCMVVFAEDDHWKILDLAGLDQGHRLKHLIEGAEASGHDQKGIRILDQQGFPDEEIIEVDIFIQVWIMMLFHRQRDITSNGPSTYILGTAVGGFHNAGTASSHDRKTYLSNFRGELTRHIVIRMVFFEACRAKHRHTGAGEMERSEAPDKLQHYFDRKLEFLPAGAWTFQECYLIFRIDLTGFFNHGRLIPLKPTGFFVKSNAPDHN